MSAAEKLRALIGDWQSSPEVEERIASALPQIVAMVEAAENAEGWMVAVRENELETFLQVPLGEWLPVVSALTALDEALRHNDVSE